MIHELYNRVVSFRAALFHFRSSAKRHGLDPDQAIFKEIAVARDNLAVIREHLLLLAFDNGELGWVDEIPKESSSD